MHDSPRVRRLRSDLAAMERLRSESSVLRFRVNGSPAQHYLMEFRGKSLARFQGKVTVREQHEVEIKLGASYPRSMPEIRWISPIYHPNISEIGMVCLGGYGTHWVPSLNLDELCGMLWDMARFHNYDIRSPYNRDAALWVANQTRFMFPLDSRPLRDVRQALGRIDGAAAAELRASPRPKREQAEPGSLATKYRSFLKRFSDEINGVAGPGKREEDSLAAPLVKNSAQSELPDLEILDEPETTDPPATEDPPAVEGLDPNLILLEFVEDHGPEPPLPQNEVIRLRASDQEILFID